MKNQRVIVMGAGASKAYSDSPTQLKMPISSDFFQTYSKLEISSNPWVLVGYIINYLEHYLNIPAIQFGDLTVDIETVHTEMEERLIRAMNNNNFEDILRTWNAYVQMHFLFASVLNEIQNGPISQSHRRLAQCLSQEDCVVTFNWDCLIDRALESETSWVPDQGYYVVPSAIYDDKWVKPYTPYDSDFPLLLKLHGSTNWLTSYLRLDENNQPSFTHTTGPEDFYVYKNANSPYSCYDGRYMPGYQPYSFGYYPPNIPPPGIEAPEEHIFVRVTPRNPFISKGTSNSTGLESMPLIIPPVKSKNYNMFGGLFVKIWEKTRIALSEADEIHIYGYSFPSTDVQVQRLFEKAFLKRQTPPNVVIVNPQPAEILHRFTHLLGVPQKNVQIFEEYIDESFDYAKLLS